MGKHTHLAIKSWAQECLRWEDSNNGDINKDATEAIHGADSCSGFMIKGDATSLSTNDLVTKTGSPLPALRLCILDKPKVGDVF